jgi:polyhydroxybutyrate depolymerase
MIALSACQFRAPQNQEPSASPTREPASAAPTIPSPPTIAPTSTNPAIAPLGFVTGRNDYVINVDDTPRKFLVYVPQGYDPSRPTPVVFMFHGSNQGGPLMYENTGWAAKADQENFIVVFPTSWKYPLLSEAGVHEKWNTPGTAQDVPPGTELKDDVHFMRLILDNLMATFNVDDKRIFASGFSNGGGFVITRLMLEMNDVFAAFAASGAGLIGEGDASDITFTVNASLYNTIGTDDNKISEGQDIPVPFPFAGDDIVNDPNFGLLLQKTTSLLGLDMSHTVESDPAFTRLTFNKSLVGADNE